MLKLKLWCNIGCAYGLIFCAAGPFYGQTGSILGAARAVLSGKVLDRAGSVVIDNNVVITDVLSGRATAQARIDTSGRYRLSVPSGIYRVSLANTRDILPYTRAAFRLEDGEHVLDLWPVFRTGVELTIGGDHRLADPSVKLYSRRVSSSNPALDFVIRYERKHSFSTVTEYTGEYLMLSFELVTIQAQSIRVDEATSNLTAEGNVKVYVDQYHATATHVEVNLASRSIRLAADGEIIEKSF